MYNGGVWHKREKTGWRIVTVVLLTMVVLTAAVLLYRWMDRVRDADRLREKELLEAAFRGFQSEFASIFQEIFLTYRPLAGTPGEAEIETHLADMFLHWQRNARHPQILAALGLGIIDSTGSPSFHRFRTDEKKFDRRDWPVPLQNYHDYLVQHWSNEALFTALPAGFVLAFSAEKPVMAIPTTFIRPLSSARRPERERSPFAFEEGPWTRPDWPLLGDRKFHPPQISPPHASPGQVSPGKSNMVVGWCFVEVDAQFLRQQLLPNLLERHFGRTTLSRYRLAIVAGNPREMIFVSPPDLTLASFNIVDLSLTLLRPQGRFGPGFRPGRGFPLPSEAGVADLPPDLRPPMGFAGQAGTAPPASALWQLLARHRSGSIDAEVNATRHRNLAIGYGILFLLTGSIITLMLSAQKARSLARQQMEFVAGVSHELRTPLAVIQSAGYNLAHGVPLKTERVQEYGTVIQTESRRLTDMIEQILSYAGIQSARENYHFHPTEIGPLLRRLMEEYRQRFADGGWTVEQNIEPDIPPVWADEQILQRAFRNLLENALKYAAAGKWLRLSAATDQSRTEVVVKLEDHGPGIDPGDLPKIFESFYRGRKVAASSIPGAGLGLSLLRRYLKAHHGSIRVGKSPGGGAAFILTLPAHLQSEP